MTVVLHLLIWATSAYPLAVAWRANWRRPLAHALGWVSAAWVLWGVVARTETPSVEVRYIALALTAAAGVAVLEPRRPGAAAWHVVSGGLFVVLLTPLAQGWGRLTPRPEWSLFLAVLLLIGVGNYLPTRLGLGALLLLAFCLAELAGLTDRGPRPPYGLVPWLAWVGVRMAPKASPFDARWRGFRDRVGALWTLRIREQFHRVAANAGWPTRLSWGGATPADVPPEAFASLAALLKRFEP